MSLKTVGDDDDTLAEEGNARNPAMERANSIRMPRLPKPLTAEEKKYLMAVDRGDMAAVKRMIGRSPLNSELNVNCVDPLGRGALLMAIEAQNIMMVETLIVMGVSTGDSLLHAIDKQFVEAVELLLEHEELIHKDGDPYSWEAVDRDTATFTPEITPLILASHRNNYEILKILLDRGATIPMPHDIRCVCNECVGGVKEDSLRHSASRINSYKALASPSLIALTSTDPLLTSFELSWELKQLSASEYEFRSDYLELRKKSQEFAVSLLGHTRTSHELRVMLNYDPRVNDEDTASKDIDLHECGLARLRLAIKYKQKKFVAHPWVQQLLSSMWYDGLPGFRQKSTVLKCLEILRIIVTFPLYCIWYMFAPKHRIGKLIRKPFMKFLTHASSYLLFLLILILVSQRVEEQVIDFLKESGYFGDFEKTHGRKRLRGNAPQVLEYIVLVYVIGFIAEETRELFRNGFFTYVSDMWNAIDFLRNFLYVSVAGLRCWAFYEQQSEITENPAKAFIPRENWDDFDPQLVAEGLFAAANIFSALKLVHVSTINPHLGPLQISLGRMVYDILKFFFFYTLVLFAFACGLNQLLWYFADLEKQKCYTLPGDLPDWKNSGEACMKWRRFGNLFESSQSLFWASFGMVGLADFELSGIKSYTRFWGLLMFGSYCVINVIVLLNLLIAMLSNTYAEIAERADTEWKFARTKLWLSYFDEDATLPSPFNLVPTPKQVKRFLTRFIPNLAKIGTSLKHREARRAELLEHGRQYTAVMRALVWRYVSGLQRIPEEEMVTEDDVNEVKGEISALRCDLIEVFRRNGMNVSSITDKPVAAGRRTREWERRLLRGFHVAPAAGDERMNSFDDGGERNDLENSEDAVREKERSAAADRFRRMARLALLNRERLSRPPKHLSHIGRSQSSESMKSRQSLKQAIEAAKKQTPDSGSTPNLTPNNNQGGSESQKLSTTTTSTKAGESTRPTNIISSGENPIKENNLGKVTGKSGTMSIVTTTATSETETEKRKCAAPPVPSLEKNPTLINLVNKPKGGTEAKVPTPTATPALPKTTPHKPNAVVPSKQETTEKATGNSKDLTQCKNKSSFDATPREDTLISVESDIPAPVTSSSTGAITATSSSNLTLNTSSSSSAMSLGGDGESSIGSTSLGKIDSLPLLSRLDSVKTIKKQPGSWF